MRAVTGVGKGGGGAVFLGFVKRRLPRIRPTLLEQTDVAALLSANRALVDKLATVAPDVSELTRLRFAMQFPDSTEAMAAMKENVAWRSGEGKAIVEAAGAAVAKATEGGGWDNAAVRDAAPHAAASVLCAYS